MEFIIIEESDNSRKIYNSSEFTEFIKNLKSEGVRANINRQGNDKWYNYFIEIKKRDGVKIYEIYINKENEENEVLNDDEKAELDRIVTDLNKTGGGRKVRKSQRKKTYKKRNKSKRRTGKINKRKGVKYKIRKKRKTKRKMNHMNTMRNYTKRKNTKYKNTKYKNTKLRNNKRRNMRGGSYDDQIRWAIEESLKDMETAGGSGENTGWSCAACTLHNTAGSTQCTACDTPRGASNPVNPVSRDRARGGAPNVEGVQSGPIETRGQIINRTKLEAAQVRLAFAKMFSGSKLVDGFEINILTDIGLSLSDELLVVLPDNHPRRKWDEWKALYAPGEVQEPEFIVNDQVTFTLDSVNIGDRYYVDLGNYPGAPVNYRGAFKITDFNYRSNEESFRCEVILSDRPNMIEFIYNIPESYMAMEGGENEGWTTRWRNRGGGEVINCSRIEPS